MKRNSTVWLLLAVIIIGVVVVLTNLPTTITWPGSDTGTGAVSEVDQQAVTSPLIPRPSGATLSHIAYVHDGDTLYLQPDGTSSREDQIKVRLIGIDTPELRPEVECFGVEARDYLRSELPEGTAVWIMSDAEPVDQYGRSLLYLWTTDDHSVNLDLVEKGYATALNIAPSNTYWKQFDAAEATAHSANLGLWGSC